MNSLINTFQMEICKSASMGLWGRTLDHVLVQMHWSQELMIIALGLDKNYLDKRYQFHQEILTSEGGIRKS